MDGDSQNKETWAPSPNAKGKGQFARDAQNVNMHRPQHPSWPSVTGCENGLFYLVIC